MDFARLGWRVIRATQKNITSLVRNKPVRALRSVGLAHKVARDIDLLAEGQTMAALLIAFRGEDHINVLGEEDLDDPELDLSDEQRTVALMDMVDGTDLLARDLGNWGSAMAFFRQGAILGAFVGVPGHGVYYALASEPGAFFWAFNKKEAVKLAGPNVDAKLETASLCFYGQKADRLVRFINHPGLAAALTRLGDREAAQGSDDPGGGDRVSARIYNLAGAPMMVKLVDTRPGMVPIDAIFELKGQLPHDVIPGAYIARRAGAILTDLEGQPIDLAEWMVRPADPARRKKYILAANAHLSRELIEILREHSPAEKADVQAGPSSPNGSI